MSASLLDACAPRAPAPALFSGGGPVKPPTYVPFQGPLPDLAGNEQGLDSAFFKFPSNLVQTVPAPPGEGGTVTAITMLTAAAAPPLEQNAAWQAVDNALGATLRLEQVAPPDYASRVNVVAAGNDLPDLIYNPTSAVRSGVIAGLPDFLRGKCQDLTDYLSGDGVKDFPNLAHSTSYTWRSAMVANRIYAIPIARAPISSVMLCRTDLLQQSGIRMDQAPTNADDFKRILQAVTRPNDNQWGIASAANTFALSPNSAFSAIWRVPNNWRLDSAGALIKDFETDEFKAAVGFARDLWQAGVWHPDTPTYGDIDHDDFTAGRFVFASGTWEQYVQQWDLAAVRNPAARIYPLPPFAADGRRPHYHAGSGQCGVVYVTRQSSPDRIRMLLSIANFLAAPFGSTEWLLNNYGVKDTDFTFNADGAPVLTDQGRNELIAAWRYLSSPGYTLFNANHSQEFAQASYAAEKAMIAAMDLDPTLGLYSPTAASGAIQAQDSLMSGVSDIVQGRRPLGDLDSLVADWRHSVGDRMRYEFQDAIAAVK